MENRSRESNVKLSIMEQREYKVVKANEIIQRARADLNKTELKILAFVYSKIRPSDRPGQEYVFNIKEYCQVFGLDYKNGNNYAYVKSTLKGIRDKSFWLTDEDGRDRSIGWFGKVIIDRGSGKVTVKLDEDMEKYVVGVYSSYTQYSLFSIIPMKSSYSMVLYELLKSYAFTKSHTFKIDDLKNLVGATTYENFKDFRKKVIEVGVREINEYTDLEVSWQPITKGKKVVEVQFFIRLKEGEEFYKAQTNTVEQIEGQISVFDYDYYT